MKKIVLLITVIHIMVLFSACESPHKENNMIEYESGNYYNKNWDESVGTYQKAIVPNKETAIEIAKVIFNGMDKSKEAQEYIPNSAFYDVQDKVWIVSFGKDANKTTLGGDCCIAIREEDGKVLRIWFGE